MNQQSLRTNEEITELYLKHIDMVYRICFVFLKNKAEAEDATHDVFMKVIQKNIRFENDDHEKAWLIVATQNHCKNIVSHWSRKNMVYDPNFHEKSGGYETDEIIQQVLNLPEAFKLPIYLYYYEGYKTDEIAKMLKINSSTLRSRLKKARHLLKLAIEGDEYE